MILFSFLLFFFGLFFWSFASVIIYRLKLWKSWIMFWRSKCPKCKHLLWFFDLIPFFSYIFSKWKCKYCKKKINIVYPMLELSTWLVFFLVWYTLIDFNSIILFDKIEIIKLFYFLFLSFIVILMIFYDILFLEIHEWILLAWIFVSLITIYLQNCISWFYIIETLPSYTEKINLVQASLEIFSYIWIIWLLYFIMLKWLKEIYDLFIIIWIIIFIYFIWNYFSLIDSTIFNSIIWILIIFVFFFFQIIVSKGKWMWWWDLRIAILLWMILGYNFIFPWLVITYFVWSIIWILVIFMQKLQKRKEINTMIPFWPFLWIWLLICLFFQNKIYNLIFYYL